MLSVYIVEFGYSGQILPSGRVPLYRGLTVDGIEIIYAYCSWMIVYTVKPLYIGALPEGQICPIYPNSTI